MLCCCLINATMYINFFLFLAWAYFYATASSPHFDMLKPDGALLRLTHFIFGHTRKKRKVGGEQERQPQ